MKKGRYLITGCAGFIGSNLVKKIYKKYDLILVDDLSEGSVFNLPKELRKKLIKKKIQEIKNLNTKKLDGIFHLAAQPIIFESYERPYETFDINFKGTLNILEISRKYKFIKSYASSISKLLASFVLDFIKYF